MSQVLILALVVLAIVVALFIPMAYRRVKEGFAYESPPLNDTELQDPDLPTYIAGERKNYIDHSKGLYNKFSDTNDVFRGNFARATSPGAVADATKAVRDVMVTPGMEPSTNAPTLLGVVRDVVTAEVSPNSVVFEETKKCEALKGRGSCATLGKPGYSQCGVCIKGGTTHDGLQPHRHIGGMLLIPDDKAEAENSRTPYQPTVGDCPPGFFFADAATCAKEVARLDCKEIGEAGGFNGRTVEGKTFGESKCAQVPVASATTFVPYDTAQTPFDVNLRINTPVGSGYCKVVITRGDGKVVGSMTNDRPGVEFIVPISKVTELESLSVAISMGAPYRPGGRAEVFQFVENMSGTTRPNYNQSPDSSAGLCARIGARLATKTELINSMNAGGQLCGPGWTSSGPGTYFNGYPMQVNAQGCGVQGLNEWFGSDPSKAGFSWCYGVKPPKSTNQTAFFTEVGDFMSPAGADQVAKRSQFGEYTAPAYRGVVLQWELNDFTGRRSAAFEPTIVSINGMGPSSISTDGVSTFKLLRRLGTFAKSTLIRAPKPSSTPMKTNQFWIWSNLATDQTVTFGVKVPGTYTNPLYSEDAALYPRGPLLTNPATATLLLTSPCLKDGQVAGKYSAECLSNLFAGSGGDPVKGKLVTANGGLAQLNKMGEMDIISGYLSGLYSLATTGRNADGAKQTAAKINDAAQKMFGFDIVNPCEDISETAQGDIVMKPRVGPLDSFCLDYLWMNAGSDQSRAAGPVGKSSIPPTYISIGDRFSGLRSTEGTKTTRANRPFRTCTREGTLAPIDDKGRERPEMIRVANVEGQKTAGAYGGSYVTGVQNLYSLVHEHANAAWQRTEGNNSAFGNAMVTMIQSSVVQQCFGINRSADKRGPACGPVARYVRVLATGIMTPGSSPCIQIPQIQVFDADGKEVAKGKPTQAANQHSPASPPSIAVNGNATNHSHGEGEYHSQCGSPDNEFWMVDLGSMLEIAKVVFFYRTDCCTKRQLAAPVQLLDASQKIVAQRYLGEVNWPQTWGNTETITFKGTDGKMEIPMGSLVAGTKVSFLTATSWDRYLRHASFAGFTTIYESNPTFAKDATFILSPGNNGDRAYVSFQSVNYPGYFLRHAGFRIYLHTFSGDPIYRQDSSFKMLPALNGDPAMVSFQSANYPSHYLAVARDMPDQAWITTVNMGSAWDKQRASWRVKTPLA